MIALRLIKYMEVSLAHPTTNPRLSPNPPFDYEDMPRRLFTEGLPTPDESDDTMSEDKGTVSVSSVFYPGADNRITDTVFRSSDGVLFYVSSEVVLQASKDAFRPIIGASLERKRFRDTIMDVPDVSSVLNIIIHAMYGLPCDKHSPTLGELETAIDQFKTYGLVPNKIITPTAPLYRLLLFYAPVSPLPVYALAAHHKIHELAEATSTYLLSIPFSSISDEMAAKMGPSYLNRLAKLQWNRIESLKATILQTPHPHPPTKDCDFGEQKKLSRAWALAASYLAWDADPGDVFPCFRFAHSY